MGSTFICRFTKINWLIKKNQNSKFGTVYDTHQIFGAVAGELVSFYYSFGLTFTNFISSGAVLQYMSDEDQNNRLDAIKQYLASTSVDRKSQTIDNPLFQCSTQKEYVGVPIISPDSDSNESVSNYSSMAQNRTLKELAGPNVLITNRFASSMHLWMSILSLSRASFTYCPHSMDYLERTRTSI